MQPDICFSVFGVQFASSILVSLVARYYSKCLGNTGMSRRALKKLVSMGRLLVWPGTKAWVPPQARGFRCSATCSMIYDRSHYLWVPKAYNQCRLNTAPLLAWCSTPVLKRPSCDAWRKLPWLDCLNKAPSLVVLAQEQGKLCVRCHCFQRFLQTIPHPRIECVSWNNSNFLDFKLAQSSIILTHFPYHITYQRDRDSSILSTLKLKWMSEALQRLRRFDVQLDHTTITVFFRTTLPDRPSGYKNLSTKKRYRQTDLPRQ